MRGGRRISSVVVSVALVIGCIDLTARSTVAPGQEATVQGSVEVVSGTTDSSLTILRGRGASILLFCDSPLGLGDDSLLQPFSTATYDQNGAFSFSMSGSEVTIPDSGDDAGVLAARCFRLVHAPTLLGPSTSLDFTVATASQALPLVRLWHAGLVANDAGDAMQAQWRQIPSDLLQPIGSAGPDTAAGFMIGSPIVRLNTADGTLWQAQVGKGDTSWVLEKKWLDERPVTLTVTVAGLNPFGVQYTSEQVTLPPGTQPPSRGASCSWGGAEIIPCPLTDGRHSSVNINASEVVITLPAPLQASQILIRGYTGSGLLVDASMDGQHFTDVGVIAAASERGFVARPLRGTTVATTYRLKARDAAGSVGTLGEVVLLP
jgi:hypothetical protein